MTGYDEDREDQISGEKQATKIFANLRAEMAGLATPAGRSDKRARSSSVG